MSRESTAGKLDRKQAVSELKRGLILQAARKVFEAEGLEGANMRAIAQEAGYTPAALYFYFDSKEAIYAEVLKASIEAIQKSVNEAVAGRESASSRLSGAAMAFFDFYMKNPRDLDLGFYLFRGGMKPKGLGRDFDVQLNTALENTLLPIALAAEDMGATRAEAISLMTDTFAHAAGLLLLMHTGRIRMFGASAHKLMERYIQMQLSTLPNSAS